MPQYHECIVSRRGPRGCLSLNSAVLMPCSTIWSRLDNSCPQLVLLSIITMPFVNTVCLMHTCFPLSVPVHLIVKPNKNSLPFNKTGQCYFPLISSFASAIFFKWYEGHTIYHSHMPTPTNKIMKMLKNSSEQLLQCELESLSIAYNSRSMAIHPPTHTANSKANYVLLCRTRAFHWFSSRAQVTHPNPCLLLYICLSVY